MRVMTSITEFARVGLMNKHDRAFEPFPLWSVPFDVHHAPAPFDPNIELGKLLMQPTRIYVKEAINALNSGGKIKALAHITGGGLVENVTRILPNQTDVIIDARNWELPPLFYWLHKSGNIDLKELYRTFNCGIGFIIVIAADMELRLKEVFGSDAIQIGTILPGNESASSNCKLIGLEE